MAVSMTDASTDDFVHEVDGFLAFTGAEPPRTNPIFILVMGVTGSGKSTFISQCSGKAIPVGHDLESCTKNLSIVSFQHPDNIHTIYFVDTPGFDDTDKNNSEILAHVAHYLSISYANRICISGIIFMHRISDNRMTGSATRNIEMFKRLVGEEAYENVAIATTMWWSEEFSINLKKERLLAEEHFRDVLDGGGKIFRYDVEPGDDRSKVNQKALGLLDHLMSRAREGPVVLKIQNEMIDERMTLGQTEAGSFVDGNMIAARNQMEVRLQEIKKELSDTLQDQNTELTRIHHETRMELELQNDRIDRSRRELAKSIIEMHRVEECRLMETIEEMECRWQEIARSKEQQLWRIEMENARMKAAAEGRTQQQERRLDQMDGLLRSVQWMAEDNRFRQNIEIDRQRTLEKTQQQYEEEARAMKQEILKLQQDLAAKQKVTSRVKKFLNGGSIKGMVEGLSSGAASATIGAIIAGTLCSVM